MTRCLYCRRRIDRSADVMICHRFTRAVGWAHDECLDLDGDWKEAR